jgi:molecular chaperone GrpE
LPKEIDEGTGTPAGSVGGGPGPNPTAGGLRPEIKVVDRRWWAAEGRSDAEGSWEPRKPSYVEQLEQQLTEKDEQIRSTIAKYKEAATEFEAARVRARRDTAKEIERGKRAVLAELLDVIDNLDRAIDAAQQSPSVQTLLEGVELVRGQFLARLEGFGVTRIPSAGQRFDPTHHEAATVVPVADPAEEDRVVGVIREGYRIGDEVLRPAIVAVGRLVETS